MLVQMIVVFFVIPVTDFMKRHEAVTKAMTELPASILVSFWLMSTRKKMSSMVIVPKAGIYLSDMILLRRP